jgi:hypothetical protein
MSFSPSLEGPGLSVRETSKKAVFMASLRTVTATQLKVQMSAFDAVDGSSPGICVPRCGCC